MWHRERSCQAVDQRAPQPGGYLFRLSIVSHKRKSRDGREFGALHAPASAPVLFGTPTTCSGSIHSALPRMAVHLVNPSHLSFGIGVITPRWLFVLAAATPTTSGSHTLSMKRSSPSILPTFNLAMSSESAYTRAMRYVATRSARSRERGERRSSSAASMRRSTPTKRSLSAGRTPSSKAMVT